MILVFSSSSPLASVALFDEGGLLLGEDAREVPIAASGALVEMSLSLLRGEQKRTEDVTLFGADLGPGSFTGTRVAVTLAKTFAFVVGARCVGFTSFDLIDPSVTVAIPSKKGEYFVRRAGEIPFRTVERPDDPFLLGFGPWFEEGVRPLASHAGPLLKGVATLSPEALVPEYWIEPSISVPKKRMGGHVG